jgi:hypothetical protein
MHFTYNPETNGKCKTVSLRFVFQRKCEIAFTPLIKVTKELHAFCNDKGILTLSRRNVICFI